MKNNIVKCLVVLTLVIVAVSYLPWIYLKPTYYILRYVIMALMSASFVLTFSLPNLLNNKLIRIFCCVIGVIIIEFITFKLIGIRFHWEDLTQLIVALMCICIGINLKGNLHFWSKLSYYYTIALVIMGLCNTYFYTKGFYIPEYYMLNEGKNQIGSIIALGALSLFFLGMKQKENRIHYWVVFFLAVEVLLLIRARSAVLALLAGILLTIIKECNWKWKWNFPTILTIIGLGWIAYILYTGFIGEELTTFIMGGKYQHNFDTISSNRIARNQEGMELFLKNPLSINQSETTNVKLIHNYLILRLVRYGIWSFPFIFLYIWFGVKILIELFRKWQIKVENVGFLVVGASFIISFLEPSFPYGPGSVQVQAFLLLGYALADHKQLLNTDPNARPCVLHICNDFTYSKVHTELYQKLDHAGIDQVVYTPCRSQATVGNNRFDGAHTEIIYSPILKKRHRLLFFTKIDRICRDVEHKVNLTKVTCLHATTLFSDGAVALRMKKRYGIPYIVAVRNTDVNDFLRYAPHLWWLHREVIREAEKVIFITPVLQQRLQNHWTMIGLRDTLQNKSQIIANGLNDYWLDHLQLNPQQHKQNHAIVYVGNFDDNKNVKRLIEAVMSLKPQIPDIHLNLVGGTGAQESDILQLVKKHPDTLTYHGRIFEKDKLQAIYEGNSVFAMASKHETFGLVYLEAMSQGLSILYTRGEGIDGLFSEKIGESVDPLSTESIAKALQQLLSQANNYQLLSASQFQDFDWKFIAQKYIDYYHRLRPQA